MMGVQSVVSSPRIVLSVVVSVVLRAYLGLRIDVSVLQGDKLLLARVLIAGHLLILVALKEVIVSQKCILIRVHWLLLQLLDIFF